jgi:hypothetical protein
MANFTPKKIDLSKINGGNRYEDGSGVRPSTFNDPIEASAYAQALATNQPLFIQNGGNPNVSIQEKPDGTPYLVFENLRGKDGEVSLSQLEQIQKVQDDKIALIENQANKNLNQIKGIYSGLIQKEIFANAEDVKISEETQITGGNELNGYVIVDNSYATVKKINGNTVWNANAKRFENAKIQGIKSVGKNIFDISKCVGGALVDNKDGTYTITKNGSNRFSLAVDIEGSEFINKPLYYQFEVINSNITVGLRIQFLDVNNNSYSADFRLDGTEKEETISGTNINRARLYLTNDIDDGSFITFKNAKICVESNIEYEPYIENTMTLPQTVELSKWDYIENQKVYRKSYTLAFDTETKINWFRVMPAFGKNDIFAIERRLNEVGFPKSNSKNNSANTILVSSEFNSTSGVSVYQGNEGIAISDDYVRLYDSRFTTLDEFKNYLRELNSQGKPLTVVYQTEQVLEETDFAFNNEYLVWDKGQETILSQNDSDGLNSFDYGANPTIENDYYILVGAEG